MGTETWNAFPDRDIKGGIRKACREWLAFTVVGIILGALFFTRPQEGLLLNVVMATFFGLMIGTPLFVIYRFARFVIGR